MISQIRLNEARLFAIRLTNVLCAENDVWPFLRGLGWIRHKTFWAPSYLRSPLLITGECDRKTL
jgi:hypothetical protein